LLLLAGFSASTAPFRILHLGLSANSLKKGYLCADATG
jgi:hypothetical protein